MTRRTIRRKEVNLTYILVLAGCLLAWFMLMGRAVSSPHWPDAPTPTKETP